MAALADKVAEGEMEATAGMAGEFLSIGALLQPAVARLRLHYRLQRALPADSFEILLGDGKARLARAALVGEVAMASNADCFTVLVAADLKGHLVRTVGMDAMVKQTWRHGSWIRSPSKVTPKTCANEEFETCGRSSRMPWNYDSQLAHD
jgi:hypothetical protein